MQRSTHRILTTHVGSLPRPAKIETPLREAVSQVVARQRAAGIDVVSDGEMSKPGFIHYVNDRLSGFAPSREAAQRDPWQGSREAAAFPEYYRSSGRSSARLPRARAGRAAGCGCDIFRRWLRSDAFRRRGRHAHAGTES